MQEVRDTAQDPEGTAEIFHDHMPELSRQEMEKDSMISPIKACPFCGRLNLVYMDPDVPVYAYCPTCKTWVSGGRDYDPTEVRYVIQKIKTMRIQMEKMKDD